MVEVTVTIEILIPKELTKKEVISDFEEAANEVLSMDNYEEGRVLGIEVEAT